MLLFQSVVFGGSSNELFEAVSLTSDFLAKLDQNTPFRYEDGERFFGPAAPIPSLNVFLLQKLGYLNGAGIQTKPLPKYSPLGELLRINRALFISEGKSDQILFYPAYEFIMSNSPNKFSIDNKNTIFVYVKNYNRKNDIEFSNEKLLCFDYNSTGKFFFVYGFSVNGQSILKKLGFYAKKHDKYNYPVFEIQDNVLQELKVHLDKLE